MSWVTKTTQNWNVLNSITNQTIPWSMFPSLCFYNMFLVCCFHQKTGDQSQPKSTLSVRNYIVLLKWSVAVICSCAHDKESARIAIFMLWFCTAAFSQPFGSTVGIKLCSGIGLGLRFRRNGLPVLINFWTKDRTKRTISKKKVGESLKSQCRSLCIMNVALQTCINNHPCRKVSWTRMFCLRERERDKCSCVIAWSKWQCLSIRPEPLFLICGHPGAPPVVPLSSTLQWWLNLIPWARNGVWCGRALPKVR